MPDVILDGMKYLIVGSNSDTVVAGQYVKTAGEIIGSDFIVSSRTS